MLLHVLTPKREVSTNSEELVAKGRKAGGREVLWTRFFEAPAAM